MMNYHNLIALTAYLTANVVVWIFVDINSWFLIAFAFVTAIVSFGVFNTDGKRKAPRESSTTKQIDLGHGTHNSE